MNIVQVFRKKNPKFFSIESVFSRVRKAWPVVDLPEVIYLPESGIKISNLFYLFIKSRHRKHTIFHVTGDAHYAVLALPRNRTILTIHDSVFMLQHNGIKRWVLKKILLDIPVWYSRHITTISEKSKQEVLMLTTCDPGKIEVIPNPVSKTIYYQSKDFNETCPLLLFIGIKPNKNLERTCEALQHLNCRLLVIGKLSEKQEYLLKEFEIDYESVYGISESEVADKYALADIILFPSLYEGFGLPVIEGFKAGRVVVTSNISPMKDIAEGSACLVDPLNVKSIREGLLKVISDKHYRDRLVKDGFEVVKKYEPENIAKQYFQIYQKQYNATCVHSRNM